MEARTFHRESDVSPSTQAAQLTKHLILGQVWTLEHHFFELATWGTNNDFLWCSLLSGCGAPLWACYGEAPCAC